MFKNLVRASLCASLITGLLGATLAVAATSPPPHAAAPAPKPPLRVAFVYVSPIGDAGWTYQHEQGRLAMQKALGDRVQSTAVEGVAEGADSERVIRDLAAQGNRLIFATSFGYLEPTLRVAADYPDVKFEHAGGYKTAANVATYNARYYEARFLAGMLAGQMSKSGVAGYVAGFPVPEVVQGINAFTLGMRAVNPKAQVRVLWLNSWFDPAREREAAQSLIDQGADVLTNHSGSPAVAQTAQANFAGKDVRVIAYQSDMRAYAPQAQLAAVTLHWGAFYTQVARSVLDGTWKPTPVWGGIKDGMVRLSAISADVPAAVRARVEARREAIVAGRFKPFSAPLEDNDGLLRLAHGALDDASIATMNWFVRGVIGSVPKP
ncbi:MAG: BMP family ABC transporter substrate-binding protein [Burkholderiales bacterium]|nr:BMP family ABC transporter substrate-binding protein [Burkholderiales bacterium]MDE2625532.1 BMP family ABC transporter substrate-binding protein [Burkholderiales bacterium]